MQRASKDATLGSLEQEHGWTMSRRGWEGWVFDRADAELWGRNSFKDILLGFFSPGDGVFSHGF